MAEVRVTNHLPHQGELLRDYEVTRADGSRFLLSDYRGKQNLVVCFFGDGAAGAGERLLGELAQRGAQLHDDETRIVAVYRGERASPEISSAPESIVGFDESGKGFAEAVGDGESAIYFTDKFREIFKVYRIASGAPLPTAKEVLGWVSFVAMQCPECHPSEWPADAL